MNEITAEVVLSLYGTSTAQVLEYIAFIKYWGRVTEDIAVITLFAQFLEFKNR